MRRHLTFYHTFQSQRLQPTQPTQLESWDLGANRFFSTVLADASVPKNPKTTETSTIKRLPSLRVVSLRSVLPNYRVQGELWRKLFAFAQTHNIQVTGPTLAINYTKDSRQTDVEVQVCLPIAEGAHVPEEAPGVDRAAVMVYVGPCEGYASAYQTFFGWIGSEKLTPAGPSREVYVKRPSGNEEEDKQSVTEIQLPIA